MLHVGNLIYLDLHKTGSSTLVRFFKDEVVGETQRWRWKHEPPRDVEKHESDLWVMSVRNPLDYYVSLWAFGSKSQKGVYRAMDPSKRGTVYGNNEPETFRRWLSAVLDASNLALDPSHEPATHTGRNMHQAARAGIGLFSLRYLILSTSAPTLRNPRARVTKATDLRSFLEEHSRVDSYIRLENLHEDLSRVPRRTLAYTSKTVPWTGSDSLSRGTHRIIIRARTTTTSERVRWSSSGTRSSWSVTIWAQIGDIRSPPQSQAMLRHK